jgi:hypothetical protein
MARLVSVCNLPPASEVTPDRALDGEVPLAWELPLPPHLDSERIQVNLSRLHALHQVGAFASSVVTEHQGETSEFKDNIVGLNADGSATSGKSKSTYQVDPARTKLIDTIPFGGMDVTYGRPIIMLDVNRPEAVQKVINAKDKGKSDEVAWAQVLDKALRESIAMIDRAPKRRRLFEYLINGSVMTSGLTELLASRPPTGWMYLAGANLLFAGMETALHKKLTGQTFLREKRWSFFVADVQPDRYLALKALSRMPGLVKAQK